MPLPEPYRKQPVILRKPWPPPDAAAQREVTPADSWTSLSAGRDPWRIILYNFRTRNPDEVNWYLYNWVGCRAVTPDGKNYRFGAYDDRLAKPAGTPPKLYIYIPPAGWEPDNDELARDLVLQTLLSNSARAVYFNTSVANVNFGEIGGVGLMVENRRIHVTYAPALAAAGIGAEYVGGADLMNIGALRADLGARSRIVHEAVHAAFDARRAYVTAIEEESVAYIAQCFYLQVANGPTLPSKHFDWKNIAIKAWPIATAKRTGVPSSATDWEELKKEVRRVYTHLPSDPWHHYTHNGVG
jgi:hypothetical protein